jgi:hypothetical protein
MMGMRPAAPAVILAERPGGAGYPSAVTERENLHRPFRSGYEVWFLTLTDPSSGLGFWIRSTLTAPQDGEPYAGTWFARFDPSDPDRTFGIHRRSGAWQAATDRFEVSMDGSVMASGAADGSIEGGGHDASWSLTWPTGPDTYRPLPGWMYRSPAVPAKPYAPNVDTRVAGVVTVDGERLDLVEAPADQGHVVGRRHAERWAWAHCGDFQDDRGVVQALTAQSRRGPALTPFVTSVGVLWDGRWIRLSKLSRRRDFGLGSWKVDVGNRRYRLTGRVEAPARDLVRARYGDPDGTDRFCHNSEIASSRWVLFERTAGAFEEVALFESRHTTHAEWAGRTPGHAVQREHRDVTAE